MMRLEGYPFYSTYDFLKKTSKSKTEKLGVRKPFLGSSTVRRRKLATTQWLHEEFCFTDIFLCSIYQLPKSEIDIQKLLGNFSSVEFYSAIEGVHGKGVKFLKDCFKERDSFEQMDVISESDSNWPDRLSTVKKSYS